jgi:hypothetical protein
MTDLRRALIVGAVLLGVMFGLPGVGAVREAAAQIAVTAADPPAGEQGTLNLSVLIKGKGFKAGAKAKFFKTGTTDPAGVNVTSTQFVSSTQLIATVDIADVAALSLFDIQVANTDGRTGKGTELFKVVQKTTGNINPPPPIDVAVALDVSAGSKITPEYDPSVPYPGDLSATLREGTTDTYDYHFTFWLRYGTRDLASRRSVVFDFGPPRYAAGDKVPCYPSVDYPEDRANVPYLFSIPASFLTTTGRTEGSEKPNYVTFQTTYEWRKDADGTWRSTEAMFDLRPYVTGQPQPPDDQPHYVEFFVDLLTPSINDLAHPYIAYNGPVKPPSAFSTTRGLAEVTPAPGGGFILKPVSAAALFGSSLPGAALYPPLGLLFDVLEAEGQANLVLKVPLERKRGFKALSGVCNLGTFNLPFVMTVK